MLIKFFHAARGRGCAIPKVTSKQCSASAMGALAVSDQMPRAAMQPLLGARRLADAIIGLLSHVALFLCPKQPTTFCDRSGRSFHIV